MRLKKLTEGWKELPPIDREKYQPRDGLEGPIQTLSGKVVYYDPKAGKYIDPDTDMYLSYDDFRALDNDYSGMKNKGFKESSGDNKTYAKISYDYSEDWASIELYKDGKKVEDWDDYFGANETGNPLARQFIKICKKHGVDPMTVALVDGETGANGSFNGKMFKWEDDVKKSVNEEAADFVRDMMRVHGWSQAKAEAEAKKRFPEEYGIDPNANRHVEIRIGGKPWKVVAHKNIAFKIKATLEAKGKEVGLYYTDKPVSEAVNEEKDWTDKRNWPIGLMVKHPKPEITQWYKWDGQQWVSKGAGYPVSELDPEIEPYLDKAGAYEAERLKGMPNETVNEAEKRWKQTSMSPEEATAMYGKENVRVKKGALRNGDDMVEVFVESAKKESLSSIVKYKK